MLVIEVDCFLRRSSLDRNDNVPLVIKRKSLSLRCVILRCKTPCSNGSASDSRSEGCVFKSPRSQARISVELVSYRITEFRSRTQELFSTMTFCNTTNHTYTINLLNSKAHKPTEENVFWATFSLELKTTYC